MPENVDALKRVASLLAIVLVVACGSSSTASHRSPGASAFGSASPSPDSSPAASPAATPSPPTPITGGYEVLATQGSADTYNVSIIGVDGKVVASAQPSSPTPVTCGDSAAALLPVPVTTSKTRAYFLDQQGNVNFLTPNGETGQIYRLPTGGGTRSLFAISPDESLMSVVQIEFTASGATTRLYLDQLQFGGLSKLIFSQTGAYTLWPLGWQGNNNLVLAKVPACTQGGGPLCCGPLELHVVDPASAIRRATVGGPACVIAGPPSPAGAVCEDTKSFSKASVLDWTGATLRSIAIQGPTPAFIALDGGSVAFASNTSTTFEGIKQTLDLIACAWIDSNHVISGGDTQSQARIGDVRSGALVPVAAQGTCAGRIPGGF